MTICCQVLSINLFYHSCKQIELKFLNLLNWFCMRRAEVHFNIETLKDISDDFKLIDMMAVGEDINKRFLF